MLSWAYGPRAPNEDGGEYGSIGSDENERHNNIVEFLCTLRVPDLLQERLSVINLDVPA